MPEVPAIQPLDNPLTGLIRLQELQGLAQERQMRGQEYQARAQELQQRQQQMQAAQAAQQRASQVWQNLPRTPDDLVDVPALMQQLGSAGAAPKDMEGFATTAEKMNQIHTSYRQQQKDHLADLANVLLDGHDEKNPVTNDSIHLGLAAARGMNLATDDDVQQMTNALSQGVDPDHVLKTVRGLGSKWAKPPTLEKLDQTQSLVSVSPSGEATTLVQGKPKQEPLEAKTMLVDGKAVPTNFDKSTGKYFDPVTKEDISARVEPFEKTATEAGQKEQQQKLEQEYRGVLQSELRSRSGGLGLQDMKVNQANDLMGVLDQFRGKNMPAAVQGELALGVARLLSPSGSVGVEMMNEFNQRTAQQGLSKAIAWLTGDPEFVNATPDAMRNMFEEMITRQGQISEQQRAGYFKAIRSMAPTDLAADRKTKLEQGMGLNPFVGKKSGASGGTTHMRAPDGRDMPSVPNSEVERLKGLGATVVQ